MQRASSDRVAAFPVQRPGEASSDSEDNSGEASSDWDNSGEANSDWDDSWPPAPPETNGAAGTEQTNGAQEKHTDAPTSGEQGTAAPAGQSLTTLP